MGFQDDLTAETQATRSCKIAIIKGEMNEIDAKVLDVAMENRDRIPTEVIIRALNRDPNNIQVGRKAVMKHRDKMCSCFNGTAS